MNFLPRPQQQRREKCVIKVKRTKDGGVTREISGNCTKEQLDALSRDINPEPSD